MNFFIKAQILIMVIIQIKIYSAYFFHFFTFIHKDSTKQKPGV